MPHPQEAGRGPGVFPPTLTTRPPRPVLSGAAGPFHLPGPSLFYKSRNKLLTNDQALVPTRSKAPGTLSKAPGKLSKPRRRCIGCCGLAGKGPLVGWQAQGIYSRPGPVLWARPVAGSPSGSSSQAVRAGGPRGVRGSAPAGSFGQRCAAVSSLSRLIWLLRGHQQLVTGPPGRGARGPGPTDGLRGQYSTPSSPHFGGGSRGLSAAAQLGSARETEPSPVTPRGELQPLTPAPRGGGVSLHPSRLGVLSSRSEGQDHP